MGRAEHARVEVSARLKPARVQHYMVVADRLMKMWHSISCMAKETQNGTSAPAMARLFLDHVFRPHGLPETIVLDRGPQFICVVGTPHDLTWYQAQTIHRVPPAD